MTVRFMDPVNAIKYRDIINADPEFKIADLLSIDYLC